MKLNIINTLLLVGILTYLVVGQITSSDNSKQAYVITGELFAEFEYQKELDAEYLDIKEEKNQELNFLKNQLLALETRIRSGNASEEDLMQFENGMVQFRNKEYEMNQELTELNSLYSAKIWDKLNSFVSTYGQENGYDVIFGASGEGNIMYATDDLNITDEVIQYCNIKYSGK